MFKSHLLGFIFLLTISAMVNASDLEKGKKVFNTYCAVCHGEDGKGKGPGSKPLDPKPRDFNKAEFKYKSTPEGEPPTEQDLLETINQGIEGTAMPPWKNTLKEEQKKAVIEYIKSFNPDYWDLKETKND